MNMRIPLWLVTLLSLVLVGGIVFGITRAVQYTIATQAATHFDVPYCSTSDVQQTLDAHIPAQRTQAPIIAYIHGGGWSEGDKNNEISQEYAQVFTDMGVAFISIDYRLSKEAVYPAQNEDVRCAIDYIRSGSHNWPIDSSRIIIMGDSAGGQLAALEAIQRKHLYDGVISLYGVTDLWEQISNHNDTNAIHYLGGAKESLAQHASPTSQSLKGSPPFLIIHGIDDDIVPASESKTFADKLQKAGVVITYLPVQHARHGFVGSHNESDVQAKKYILAYVADMWHLPKN